MRTRHLGAALLTAMLTVALVASMAAAALWQQWRGVEVEMAERTRTQSLWVLTGALDWARLILREDARAGGADHLGEPITTGHPQLTRLFPDADTIARVDPQVLGELGIVRQRQAALQALARAVLAGTLDLDSHAAPEHTIPALVALPGIGPWTAQYIAMRALRWPDAWPVGDVALTQALGLPDHRSAAAHWAAQQRSLRWQPWRSYAVIRAWSGAHVAQEPSP